MTDDFLATTRRRARRGMFQRLRDMGLSDEMRNQLAVKAADALMSNGKVADLAAVAVASGQMRAALADADPASPALAAFDEVRTGAAQDVQDLIDPPA